MTKNKNLKNDYFWYLAYCDNPVFVFVGHININKIQFCGLNINDKVNRIGDLNRSGFAALNRLQTFKTFVTYSGIFKEKVYSDGSCSDMLLFELNPNERPESINETCYIGYIINKVDNTIELRVPDIKVNNPVYILRPKFGIL